MKTFQSIDWRMLNNVITMDILILAVAYLIFKYARRLK